MAASVHEFTLPNIDGSEQSLSAYRGKVLLLVNVASRCGLTPQYKGLEALYQQFQARGFEVLGFPANNFAGQEPGTNAEIKQFCALRYDVKFPLFGKISVKGADQHPLYQHLTKESPFPGDVEWNFGKFLVGKDGKVIARFSPQTDPESPEIQQAITRALES